MKKPAVERNVKTNYSILRVASTNKIAESYQCDVEIVLTTIKSNFKLFLEVSFANTFTFI